MMIERIYNYFKGYVTLRITLNQPERFLNMLIINNIYLWDLKRVSPNEIILSTSVYGFKKMRKIIYEVKAKVKVIKKCGFFQFKKKVLNKKIILSGFILSTVFILFLSSLILDIKIIGSLSYSDEEILEKLKEIDLQKFQFRSNIDSDKISVKLINDFDKISWVGVYEEGSKLTIEIKERDIPPKMVEKDIPCHITARKDGVIKSMNITNGEPLVKLNDVVVKGQILVSGVLNTKYDGLRFVHSMADIIANTWWEDSLNVKLYEYNKNYTGKRTKTHSVRLFSKEIDLSFGRIIPYYNYEEDVKRRVFGFSEFNTRIFSEYTLSKKPIKEEEAVKRGKEALMNELYKNFNKEEIQDVSFTLEPIDKETINVKIFANIYENIAEQMIIRKENTDG